MTVEGVALGDRMEMALLCDLRIYGEYCAYQKQDLL